jgi:S-layer protein
MAYNQAQLVQAYTFANAGTAPTAAQTIALTALANQNASGALTDPQTLSQTIALAADNTTAVSVDTYAFFTGVAPSQAGLAALNAAYVGTGAQVGLNGENRFIAQSVSLALGNAAAKTAFAASYGSLSIADATASAYNVIVGNQTAGVNAPAAVAFLSGAAQVAYYTNFVKANVPGLATGSAADIDLAVKAAIVGEIFFNATQANNGLGIGSYATATNNLLKDLSDDGALNANNAAGINLFAAYGVSGTGTPGTPGTTTALKIGLDALVGTQNDDTFVGTLDAVTANTTLNFGDSIDGGSGNDTLSILTNVTGKATISGLALKNVENVAVTNTIAGAANVITVDATGFTGVTKVGSGGGAGDLIVTNIGSIALGVSGTVTNGVVGDATPTANTIVAQSIVAAGATAVDVTGTTQNTFGNLNIDTSGGTGTSLALRNTGSTAATVSTLKLGGSVTGLTVAATSAITLNGTYSNTVFKNNGTSTRDNVGIVETTANTLKTVTASGVGAINLGKIASTALTTVDASATTGGFTADLSGAALASLTSIKGGTGADNITISGVALAATTAIDLGAGNDTLTLGFAPTAGATINGGDGTDILGLAAASIVTAANKAQFVNFETAQLSGTADYDVTVLSGFSTINVSGGAVALKNVGANPTFNITGAATSVAVTLASTAGSTDNVNLALGVAGKNAGTIGTYTAAGVETLTVNSINGNVGTTVNTNKIDLGTGNDFLSKVVVTGAGNFTLVAGGITTALSVDANTATGGLTVTGTGAAKALNVIGTAVNDTIAAGDTGGSINAGKGGDSITLGAGADTVLLKAGDSIYDAINLANPGVGTGTRSTMDVISGFTQGTDKIDLTQISGFGSTGQGVANATVADLAGVTAKLATADIFKDGGGLQRGVLDIQITGTPATHYLVIDVDHNGQYNAATDMVVQLVASTNNNALVNTDFNFGS